jgi:hypothetical protein
MSDLPRILQTLLDLVTEHARLRAADIRAEATPPNAVVIVRGEDVAGTWMRLDGALEWVPAGGTEATHRVLTAEDALLHTVSMLVRY